MALDGSDFKVDGSKIFGGVSDVAGALDPMSMAVGFVSDKLGLPPAVKNAAKLGLGVMFANPVAVISGATGLAAEAVKEEPAKTEFVPARVNEKICGTGYAAPSSGAPSYGAAQGFSLDSDEFMKWVPSDPDLAAMRTRYLEAKAGGCDADTVAHYKQRYQERVKCHIAGDPRVRSEFESFFKVQVDLDRRGASNELIVRPQLQRPAPESSASFQTAVGSVAAGSCSSTRTGSQAGSGPSSRLDGETIDRLTESLGALDQEIEQKLEKGGELSQADMLKVQRLIQKRQELFQLTSTLMSSFHQMSMTAIQNMKG